MGGKYRGGEKGTGREMKVGRERENGNGHTSTSFTKFKP